MSPLLALCPPLQAGNALKHPAQAASAGMADAPFSVPELSSLSGHAQNGSAAPGSAADAEAAMTQLPKKGGSFQEEADGVPNSDPYLKLLQNFGSCNSTDRSALRNDRAPDSFAELLRGDEEGGLGALTVGDGLEESSGSGSDYADRMQVRTPRKTLKSCHPHLHGSVTLGDTENIKFMLCSLLNISSGIALRRRGGRAPYRVFHLGLNYC